MATWDFDDEQANFWDVLELADESGPQLIRHGSHRVYVVSVADWQRAKAGELRPVEMRVVDSRNVPRV